jgi:maleylacetate reductase
MIAPFRYEAKAARIIFGAGRIAEAAPAVEELGGRRALVLSTKGHEALADEVMVRLGSLAAGKFAGAAMHTPVEVSERAMKRAEELKADCLVAIGGGSAIGLSKAIALRRDLPQLVIPTTYAGSEMTDILGETKEGRKTTIRSPKVRPEMVIYDVDLTLSLPPKIAAASGMNAIAHAVEALYAVDGNPLVSLMAEEGASALAQGLPVIMASPGDLEPRSLALYGAWLCGACLGSAAMALHHKLCHVLGGSFNLPHAETHMVMLPYTAAYNAAAAPEAMARLARALGAPDAVSGLYDLKQRLAGSLSLKDLGMPGDGIERAATIASANPYSNPRPIEFEGLRTLIAAAYEGARPKK